MFATLDCIGKPQFVYAIKAILHLECMIIICTQHLIPPTPSLLHSSYCGDYVIAYNLFSSASLMASSSTVTFEEKGDIHNNAVGY